MYRNKLTPEQALLEIKLRMNYDSSKTLNENLMVLNEIDISGDIRDLKDEIGSFNTDEAAIIKILSNYKSKADFDKLAAAYQQKYGTDIGVSIYSAINSNDPTESQQLKDWAKSIGIDAKAVPTGDRRGTFKWSLTSGVATTPTTTNQTTTPTTTNQTTKAEDNSKNNQKTNTTNVGGTTSVSAPADLDVKKFQDWLDSTQGAWAFSRRRNAYYKVESKPENGYGKFGPSTQKMWNDPKIKEAYQNFLSGNKEKEEVDIESGQESVMGMSPEDILKNY